MVRFEYKCLRCTDLFFGEGMHVEVPDAIAILEHSTEHYPLARTRVLLTVVHKCADETGYGTGNLIGFSFAPDAPEPEKIERNGLRLASNESPTDQSEQEH